MRQADKENCKSRKPSVDARRRGKEKGEGLNGKLNSTHHITKAQSKLMNSVEYFPAFNFKSFFFLSHYFKIFIESAAFNILHTKL